MSILEIIQKASQRSKETIRGSFGIIEKSRSGIYSDNPVNRKLHRVGQKYGSKKEEEQPKQKVKEPEKNKKQKQFDEEKVKGYAKKATDEQLKLAAEKHEDEKVKKIAQAEIEERVNSYKTFNKRESLEYYQNNQSNMDNFDDYVVISDYKFRGYVGMNEGLRHGNEKKLKEYKEKIDKLSNFINHNKIKDNIILYRRVRTNFFSNLKKNTIIKDKGFSSASLKKDFDKFNFFGNNLIEIRCPKGSKVSSLNESNLLEYCIDKDSRFKVIKNKGNNIVLELIK